MRALKCNLKKSIHLLLTVLLMSGCAGGKTLIKTEKSKKPKEAYQINLAKTDRTGSLLIRVGWGLWIRQYGVSIDNNEVILITRSSDTRFILDEGQHQLKIFTMPSFWMWIYGEYFGKPTVKQILIKEGKTIAFKYTRPYWVFSQGSLRKYQIKERRSK